MHSRSISIMMVRLHPNIRVRFERSGLAKKLGAQSICDTNEEAVMLATSAYTLASHHDHADQVGEA